MSINQVVRLDPRSGGVTAGPQLPFAFSGTLQDALGGLWLGTEQGTYQLNPVTLAVVARLITGNGQELVGTDVTTQVLSAGGSEYVSYPGGIARYPG